MKKKTKKKRVLTAAQKAGLARGRAKLQAKRASKKTIKRKPIVKEISESIVVTDKKTGVSMPKKRKSVQVKTAVKTVASRAKRYITSKSGAVSMLKDAALAVGGGVAAGVITNKLPIQNPKIKASIPIVLGIALASTMGKKSEIARGIANGMIVLGSVGLFRQFAPNVPMLAGEEDNQYYLPYQPMEGTVDLGYSDNNELSYMGESVEIGNEENYLSPANY